MPSSFTHVVTNGRISFFLMPEKYSIEHTHTHTHTRNFFIHSSISGHLDCFHVLPIVIMLQWTAWVCVYIFEIVILFPLDMYTEVGLLDHVVVLVLIFWATLMLFSIVAISVHVPTTSAQRSPFLYIFTLSFVFLIIAKLTGGRCYLIAVWVFISPMISDAEHLFIYPLAICVPSLGQTKTVYLDPLSIFN